VRRVDCQHESDALDAVFTGRWPERAEPELRAHVAGCAVCRDLVTAAVAFEAESTVARSEAVVPEASVVWLRAQLRARHDAARVAVRPITVAQAVGLASAVGVAGAVFGATATWFQNSLGGIWSTISSLQFPRLPDVPPAVLTALSTYGLLVAGVAACFLLAPVVVYLAGRER
jgi:predicted anti-sigma-YlaC factor YlaD